jgi:hypothetical protein
VAPVPNGRTIANNGGLFGCLECCQVGFHRRYRNLEADARRNVTASDGRLVIHGIKMWFWPLREGLCSPGSAEAMGEEGRPPFTDVWQRSWCYGCADTYQSERLSQTYPCVSQAYADLINQVQHVEYFSGNAFFLSVHGLVRLPCPTF